MKKTFAITAAVFFALISIHTLAQADAAIEGTDSIAAKSELQRAEKAIAEMEKAGFNTTRVKDVYQAANQLFEAQVAYEQSNGTASYADIISKAREIVGLKNLAFSVSDELKALGGAIKEREGRIDMAEPKSLYAGAETDLKAERYESAKEKISQAYQKISELESKSAASRVLSEATKTLAEKIIGLWKELLIAAIIIAAAAGFGFSKLMIYVAKIKMEKLLLEKRILEELTQHTQDSYFNKGKLSETGYHIKIKKYGELIRDINRQLPLIREEIEERKGTIWKRVRKKN